MNPFVPRYEGEKVDRNPSPATMLSGCADDQEHFNGLHSILGMNNIHTQNTMKTDCLSGCCISVYSTDRPEMNELIE